MIIGHQKQWQFLKKSAELGKLSHAYLFTGQEKLGKKTLAIEFANWLFKEDVLKRQHPDFIFIQPLGKEIQISQIRDLIWRLSLKPVRAPFKIAIIDRAHYLNQEAENCFLKTLEEPKGETILILITESPEFLFPTIRSRCETIKFYPVPKSEIENFLINRGFPLQEVKEISSISAGRPGVAIDLISEPKRISKRKEIIKKMIEVSRANLAERFQYARELAKESNLTEILEIWLYYFRNILIERCLIGNVKYPGYSIAKLKNILRQIQNISFLISTTNINPRLALEILMLELEIKPNH